MMSNLSQKKSTSKIAKLAHRLRHDRGAVLVEAAICIPLLLLLILGLVEAGIAWEAKSSTVSGVRTGVLRASTSGDAPETDLLILQSIIGEVGAENIGNIEAITIFEANGDAEDKFDDCTNGALGAECVIYTDQNLFQNIVNISDGPAAVIFAAANFDSGIDVDPATPEYDCDATKLDFLFCAAQRTENGDSTIGVAIRYEHPWFTGIFPFSDPVFEEFVVSSTFTDGGSDVTAAGAPPVGLPFTTTVGDFDGTQPYGNSDVTFSSTAGVNPTTSTGTFDSAGDPVHLPETFLGRYEIDDRIDITVENQTPGEWVCVEFDLLIVGSWDGGDNDSFQATIESETTAQTGDIVYREGNIPGGDMVNASDRLGYTGLSADDDTVHHGPLCAEVRADGRVDISFRSSGDGNEGVDDESWGIDNISITS